MNKKKNISNDLSVIARETKFFGEIITSGAADILGFFEGELHANQVNIRSNGVVQGRLITQSVLVQGRFEGDLVCQSLSIDSGGTVIGNVKYGNIVVADGGSIRGKFLHENTTEDKLVALRPNKRSNGSDNKISNGKQALAAIAQHVTKAPMKGESS